MRKLTLITIAILFMFAAHAHAGILRATDIYASDTVYTDNVVATDDIQAQGDLYASGAIKAGTTSTGAGNVEFYSSASPSDSWFKWLSSQSSVVYGKDVSLGGSSGTSFVAGNDIDVTGARMFAFGNRVSSESCVFTTCFLFGADISLLGSTAATYTIGSNIDVTEVTGGTVSSVYVYGSGISVTDAVGVYAVGSGVNVYANDFYGFGNQLQNVTGDAYLYGSDIRATGTRNFAYGSTIDITANNTASYGAFLDVAGSESVTVGRGVNGTYKLVNDITNTMMLGMNSNIPTMTLTPAAGIWTTGNVGIGTATPTVKLQVNGNIAASGSLYVDTAVDVGGNTGITGCYDAGDSGERITFNGGIITETSAANCP